MESRAGRLALELGHAMASGVLFPAKVRLVGPSALVGIPDRGMRGGFGARLHCDWIGVVDAVTQRPRRGPLGCPPGGPLERPRPARASLTPRPA